MKLTSLLLATARAGLIADDLLCMNPIAQPALKDDDDERVVGGSIASADTWKWIVKIDIGCGGSIIHPNWVLTAGHCCYTQTTRWLRFHYKVHDLRDTVNTVTREPDAIIRHPDYEGSTLNNDVCLLHVAEPMVFDDTTVPACVPPPYTGNNGVEAGSECFIAGWGRVSEGGAPATVLQELMVPIISHSTCTQPNVYGSSVVEENMICAGYLEGGKDGCQGDSGGPLVCVEDNQPILRGVVSWGVGCARENSPGVYARTANYYDWILGEIAKRGPVLSFSPTDNKCEGTETYNEDLSGNGFLAAWGDGFKINKVIVGRGNSTVPYTAYGDEVFHNEGDKVRLECKLGYTHDLGKRVMQAECKCDENGACAWMKKTPEWDCISNDDEQAIPIWGGATNNFVKRVESKYIILKARVTNGKKLAEWDHDRVDLDAHPEYTDNAWWGTQPFTMFVWCPFDTRKGGVDPAANEGTMTFGDFYPGECTPDGKMCSFLSREGVHAWRTPQSTANVGEGLAGTAFFKGYIDRSAVEGEQGPITLEANKKDQWSCETGLLAGHHPDAINNMMQYFEIFKDGDFSAMLAYFRPHKDLPEEDEL